MARAAGFRLPRLELPGPAGSRRAELLLLGGIPELSFVPRAELARDLDGMLAVDAATFAYTSTAMPMLTGTLITAAGFLPIGLAKSAAGEYTFSMFSVRPARLAPS